MTVLLRPLLWLMFWLLLAPVLLGIGLATLAVNVYDRWSELWLKKSM